MFLNSERPGVTPESFGVALNKEHFDQEAARRELSQEECSEQKEVESRINLETASDQEPLDVQFAMPFVVSKQQSGNQEATKYEKEVNAAPSDVPPEAQPLIDNVWQVNTRQRLHVATQNKNDGYSSKEIKGLEAQGRTPFMWSEKIRANNVEAQRINR